MDKVIYLNDEKKRCVVTAMTFEEKMENINRGITLEWASSKLNSFRNRCSHFKLDNPSLNAEMVDKLFEHRLAILEKKANLSGLTKIELESIVTHWGNATDEIIDEANASLKD